MPENDNIKPTASKRTGNTSPRKRRDSTQPQAVEPAKVTEETRKRSRRPSAKKRDLMPQRRLRTMLAASIILCLGLIGFIIFIFARDNTPPVIQKVSLSGMTENSAIITWQTDEPATSQVTIWDSDVSVSTELDATLVSDHSVKLNGLKPDTEYKFTVMSKDKPGNEAKLEIELITPPQPYTPPPVISEVGISDITDVEATITWQTDKPATSQVEYGETDSYSLITSPNEELTENHSITLTGLKPNTPYHFRVKSKDAGGNEAMSEDQTFITLSAAAAAVEIAPEIGKRAPDFTLPTLDNKELSLSQFRGKIVMVNFWVTSCGACASEMPHIQAVFNTWPRNDLEILAVNTGERAAFVQNFVNRRGLTFPALLDSDETVSNIYRISSLPTTFFINSDGIVGGIKKGSFTSQFEIEAMLKSL